MKVSKDFSDERKKFFEELLFRCICATRELYLAGRILRTIQNILNNDSSWIIENIPAHKDKLLILRDDDHFKNNLNLEILELILNIGIGDRRMPPFIAGMYYRVLESCKGSKANYEWFREYVKSDGVLSRRLESSKIDFHFHHLPLVPMHHQANQDWAKKLRRDMLLSYSSYPTNKVVKAHNGSTRKIMENTQINNEEYFKNAEIALIEDGKENETTKIINLFLPMPYKGTQDLMILEDELGVHRRFK